MRLLFCLLLLGACAPPVAQKPPAVVPPPRNYWDEAQTAQAKGNIVDAYSLSKSVEPSSPNSTAAQKLAADLAPKVEKLQARLIQKADDAVTLGFINRGILLYKELLSRFSLGSEKQKDVEKKQGAAREQLAKLKAEFEAKLRSARDSFARGDAFDAYRAFMRASDMADEQGFEWSFVEEQQLELARLELPENKRIAAVRQAKKKRRATSAQPQEAEAIVGAVDTFATQEQEISKLKSVRDLVERARDYRRKGMLYESLVSLEEAKRKDPDAAAVKLLIDELDEERRGLIEEYLEIADRFFAKQDLEAAVPYFRRVKKLDPDNIRANEAIHMFQTLEKIKQEQVRR